MLKPLLKILSIIKKERGNGTPQTILDNCSESGTLAVACKNTKRNYICIEKDENYYDISIERLKKESVKKRLF